MKKIFLLVAMLCLMLFSTACANKEKDFTCDELTITLDSSFTESSQVGYNKVFLSKKYLVAITKNTTMESYNLDEFTELVEKNTNLKLDFIKDTTASGVEMSYTLYDNFGANNIEYSYLSAFYKYNGTFFAMDMAVEKSKMSDKVKQQFITWAKSVTFN